MLTLNEVEKTLKEYIDLFVPIMQRWNYHLILAKGGRDYPHLPEQSMFAHVINGIFGLCNIVKIIIELSIPLPALDQETLRKALALYTIHDIHKLPDFQKIGTSEFSIPLSRLREEYKRLELTRFTDVDEYLMRAANVSKRSAYQGDLLLGEEDGSFLWLLVRIADAIASMTDLRESNTLMGYLKQLAPELGSRFRLYYHEIRDVRGVLTNLIHSVTAQFLEQMGLKPVLYFSTGTLYLGPKQITQVERSQLLQNISDNVLNAMAKYGQDRDAAAEALRRKNYDFEKYVYAFADVPSLLEIVQQETLRSKADPKIAEKDIDNIAEKKHAPVGWRVSVDKRFAISLSEIKTFNEYWSLARRYLLYVDTLLRDLNPGESRIEWFIHTFSIPLNVAEALQEDALLLSSGGVGKYVTIIAYHFLKGEDFHSQPAESLPVEQVLARLHQRVLKGFEQVNTRAGREAAMAEAGFRSDLLIYLDENLSFSFAHEIRMNDDAFGQYNRAKTKGHTAKVCSICNRPSEQITEIREGILGDFVRVFSNRVLPAQEAPQGNRTWCPVCHLEFILRKLVGLSIPSGADKANTYRIYIYALPTFSFSADHIRLFEPLLNQFRQISALPVRDFGANAPGAPRVWIERRTLDPDWFREIQTIFNRQSQWIGSHGGHAYRGTRLITSRVAPQPNYYLIIWDESSDELTHTEAWAKATFAAVVISALTNARVFVTEHPFLSAALATELKPTVTLDAAPPIIRAVIKSEHSTDGEISLYGREKGGKSDLERVLDLTAALWVVTADVHSKRDSKDKEITERLALAATEPLAGAHFYKEYGRLKDGQSPHPPLSRACEILLEHLGGEMMDLCSRLTEKSLEIRLPFRAHGRGKAHNYELVLREAVDGLRAAFKIVPELRQTSLTGQRPSDEAITELKHHASGKLLKSMERRQVTQRGEGIINPWRRDLGELVGEFLDLLVDDVFLQRANGSFAKFLRLENNLADGVYYYTDRVINQKWEEYQQLKREREANTLHP